MVESRLGYEFRDKQLLKKALTHSSKSTDNYERLEFLGDSILDFLVGEYFFKKTDKPEGDLTVLRSRFISEQYLSGVFDKLDLEKEVLVGKSFKGAVSKAVKCDVIESIIAAIYLDSGIKETRKFVYEKLDLKHYTKVKDTNYKSKLQELIQANFKCRMSYETEKIDDGFLAKFYMDDDEIATGKSKSKAEAEQNCAKEAIGLLFEI